MVQNEVWHKAANLDELPEGRVKTVVIGTKSIALTHYDGQYGALDNHCPHQGGPLGEGSIENCLLRCPWRGWDYCPLTGKPPGEFAEEDGGVPTYPTEVRDYGVYIGILGEENSTRTVTDVMVETMINSASVFAALTKHTPADAVIAIDVGNNTYSFGRYFECSGQQDVLMSGYLGSIGFGYPAAMGAWAATRGKRPILCVTGDGGFGQYLGELTTAVKYKMQIVHVLLNNHELGKISKEQRADELPVWHTSLHNPNFAEYAKNCGAHGARITDKADLGTAIAEAFSLHKPSLIEVMTDATLV